MLDASRHFQRPEYVKRLLDIMALHKLNVFHWHLVDGHGWRIEIEKYPELTRVGAWRNQPGYDSGPYGGFYTRDEIREIVAYAKARHITIVPEIEMPGHSWAAIAAYPWLSCKDEPQEVAYFFDYPCRAQRFPSIPGSDVLCAGKEETFVFLEGVLDEVLKLFPGNFIHVGGDEVDKRTLARLPPLPQTHGGGGIGRPPTRSSPGSSGAWSDTLAPVGGGSSGGTRSSRAVSRRGPRSCPGGARKAESRRRGKVTTW